MFSHIKPSAIAVAFFVAFVLPFGTFYITPVILALVTGQSSGDFPTVLSFFWFAYSFLAPVVGGYLAAHVARVQPMLHGLIVVLLAFLCSILFIPSARGMAITFAVYVTGGIFGGWLWRRFHRVHEAP